ncbi:MAG: DHCW motif cupin fold protein [Spirochaetia bacterium]
MKRDPRGKAKNENRRCAFCNHSAEVPTTHPGETGHAAWRTLEVGNIRLRLVEYSPGHKADHRCKKGHVLLVLKGELTTELSDGRRFEPRAFTLVY